LKQWADKLKDKDPANRDAAVRTIPYFRDPAKVYMKDIIGLMRDPDLAVRVSAVIVVTTNVNSIEKPDLIKTVVALLDSTAFLLHPEDSVRFQGVLGVARMGSNANRSSVILRLSEILKSFSASYQLRAAAADAVGQIARGTRPLVPEDPETGPDAF